MSTIDPMKIRAAQYAALHGASSAGNYRAASPQRTLRKRRNSVAVATAEAIYLNEFVVPNPTPIWVRLLRQAATSFLLLLFGTFAAYNWHHSQSEALGYALAHFIMSELVYGASGNPWIALVDQLIFNPGERMWYLGAVWVSQFVGAWMAVGLASSVLPTLALGVIQPVEGVSLVSVFVVEAIGAFLYGYVHTLLYRTSQRGEAPIVLSAHAPLVLAVVYFAMMAIFRNTTGCVLNLWVSLVPAIATNNYSGVLAYAMGDLVGYLVAAGVAGHGYLMIHEGGGASADD